MNQNHALLRDMNDGSLSRSRRGAASGFTLVEALTAMTVVTLILAMSAPSALRIMEEAHADTAGVNLNAIWNAQRFYWLENRTYAADLATLEAAGMLDATISSASGRYTYAIDSADDSTFLAAATRTGSSVWSGEFTIDETGAIAGEVQKTGADYVISPGFQ
jgi:type IV pilus assembly protein PilE